MRAAPAPGLRPRGCLAQPAVAGPPVAPRYAGGGEVERPRYLEDEGSPRPESHLRRAPPARPHGPNPTERVRRRGARGRSRGRRSRRPEPGRGSVPRAAARRGARRKSTESSSLVQKWRRAESLPLRKGGRGGGGRGARAGWRDAEDADAPGSGRSCSQTEPRPALRGPKRGPVAGRGREEGGICSRARKEPWH